jgi:hypothetical protein
MRLALKSPTVGVALDKLVHPPVRGIPVEALIGQPYDKGRAPFVELPILIVLQRFTDHQVQRHARDVVTRRFA